MTESEQRCGICQRLFPKKSLTGHHCVPKEEGGTWQDIDLCCPQCHSMVHATFKNKTLALLYPTMDALRKAPELQKYIKWVRKQPVSVRSRNKDRRRKV